VNFIGRRIWCGVDHLSPVCNYPSQYLSAFMATHFITLSIYGMPITMGIIRVTNRLPRLQSFNDWQITSHALRLAQDQKSISPKPDCGRVFWGVDVSPSYFRPAVLELWDGGLKMRGHTAWDVSMECGWEEYSGSPYPNGQRMRYF
jgi:hypothetical protein